MEIIEDWLEDPFIEMSKGSNKTRQLKYPKGEDQYGNWQLFHYSTNLKLNGAKFFCKNVIDATQMSKNEQLEWYLDAFFFELMAACNTLLQELNTVYAYDLKLEPESVRWDKIKDKLPKELVKYIKREQGKDWLKEVKYFRNLTTHQYRIPKSRNTLHGSAHDVFIGLQYIDKKGKVKIKEISICENYLSSMANHINSIWLIMAQEFE